MSGIFLKFKRRLAAIRLARAIMSGVAVGLITGGTWLALSKLKLIGPEPITSVYVGIAATLIVGIIVFLLGRKSKENLATELDDSFGLKARVQTMIAYEGEDGDMLDMQRQDAEQSLSHIPLKAYKFKKLWIYITALMLGVAVLVGGFVVPNLRNYVPPQEDIPFEFSNMQKAGLKELIKYVDSSDLEEEFKTPMVAELRSLYDKLCGIETQADMLVAVNGSMEVICDITYASSTAKEILDELWNTNDIYFKHLAMTLDTSSWTSPSWGDFAESISKYMGTLMGDDKKEGESKGIILLAYAIDSMSLKLNTALDNSMVDENDEIYLAISNLFYGENGLVSILENKDALDDITAREALMLCFNEHSEELFNAISLNKVNAGVGEYAMMRLAGLFIVRLPDFERPIFIGQSINDKTEDEDDNNKAESDGGVGDGAIYGSSDMVLDPLTGEYVEYGTLLDKYYAIMYERLDGDSYTDGQKEMIKKYFGLLYSGIEE